MHQLWCMHEELTKILWQVKLSGKLVRSSDTRSPMSSISSSVRSGGACRCMQSAPVMTARVDLSFL